MPTRRDVSSKTAPDFVASGVQPTTMVRKSTWVMRFGPATRATLPEHNGSVEHPRRSALQLATCLPADCRSRTIGQSTDRSNRRLPRSSHWLSTELYHSFHPCDHSHGTAHQLACPA